MKGDAIMRVTLVAITGLIVWLAVFIAQGGRERPLVLWNALDRAEAASGQEKKSAAVPKDLEASAQELEAEADAYDEKADEIQALVMKDKREAAAITPLMDTKGFRRSALLMAAMSQSKVVAEMRQLAAHHRSEAKRLRAKIQAH
jgi:hypothetical protein